MNDIVKCPKILEDKCDEWLTLVTRSTNESWTAVTLASGLIAYSILTGWLAILCQIKCEQII